MLYFLTKKYRYHAVFKTSAYLLLFKTRIQKLKTEITAADAIVIGAGAGLSTSAGFIYNGERFHRYFSDFEAHFGIRDMYSGGFYPYPDAETRWAFWARNIYVNRYMDPPKTRQVNLLRSLRSSC